jgi:hypothetical protein
MVDVAALIKGLPVSVLEPNDLAYIKGIVRTHEKPAWQDNITLLEPPAGQRVPYIDPLRTLEKLLRGQGGSHEHARTQACEMTGRMRKDVADSRWVNFLDSQEPESPECLPVTDFLLWLREKQDQQQHLERMRKPDVEDLFELTTEEAAIPSDVLEFIEQAAHVSTVVPMFSGDDNWDEPWALENLPPLPSFGTMIEFMPGAPWADIGSWDDWRIGDNPFLHWRESMRPVALELEKVLGEPVYSFADLDCDTDDDFVHRFLILHWCCTYKPESAFVLYLLKISGADTIDALMEALIDPASYKPELFYTGTSFRQLETLPCRFEYMAHGQQRSVVVRFSTFQARAVAESLLAQKIGTDACVVAHRDLLTEEWMKQAMRYCISQTTHYLSEDEENRSLEILTQADELYVIADEPHLREKFDLRLAQNAEDLLQLALELGIDATYLGVDGRKLPNPETALGISGAPARVAAARAKRAAFTRQLDEIRLDNEHGSSGLWTVRGMLRYDQLDLPFPLVKRIAAWQSDFDAAAAPYGKGETDAWWDQHGLEAVEIAKVLQAVVAPTVIKLWRLEGWTSIDQIVLAESVNR